MEVSQKFAEIYGVAEEIGVPDGDELFSLYDNHSNDAEKTLSPSEDSEPAGDDEISSLSEVFKPIPIPSDISPDRKYDDGGGTSPEELTTKYNPKTKQKYPPKHNSQNNPEPRVDEDSKKRIRAISDRDEKIFYDDQINNTLDPNGDEFGIYEDYEEEALNQEALYNDPPDDPNNIWDYLKIHGHTPEDDGREYVVSLLTPEDAVREAENEKKWRYFGEEIRRRRI